MAAPDLAFPSALGHGRFSQGGRGGDVLYVTSNADSLDPGTFRHALSVATGPRTVIFRVSGDIVLLDDVGIFDPFITIAGQTAPGGGVCIRGGSISIRTNDVIIRHLRVRPGDAAFPSETASDPQDRDCIKIQGGSNTILDHCSFTWGVDENLSTWVQGGVFPNKITIQNSIIGEALYSSIHPDGNHSRGLLVGDGSSEISIIHNLFISNNRRNPMIKGGASFVYVLNNLMYNWGANGNSPAGLGTNFSDADATGPLGAVLANNYYRQGPNGGTEALGANSVDPGSIVFLSNNDYDIPGLTDAIYIASVGWIYAGSPEADPVYNWSIADILENVGAKVPGLDAVDARLINEALTNTGSLINTPQGGGGYPVLASGTPYPDTDSDGMDDDWEKINGFIVGVQDNNGLTRPGGYTNLEVFLNELAGDGPGIQASRTSTHIKGFKSRARIAVARARRLLGR